MGSLFHHPRGMRWRHGSCAPWDSATRPFSPFPGRPASAIEERSSRYPIRQQVRDTLPRGSFRPAEQHAPRRRTAGAQHTALDDRIVGMSRRAPPPDLFVAADGQVGELQRSVFLRIPLSLKGRNLYRQRVLRRFLASGAVRAAAALRAGVYLGLPTVTLGALPPYLLMTSEGNVRTALRPPSLAASHSRSRMPRPLLYCNYWGKDHFHTLTPPAGFCL